MKVKLISCETPTAEHYKVSVVQTAQLIIQMWRISEGDLLSFTADFQGIIHNRAVIRKLWQTQRTGTSAYLPWGFVQDLIIRVRTFLRIKGKLHFAREKQSNQLHGVLSHKPREDSRLMHINCPLREMSGIPPVPGTTCSNLGSQNYCHASPTVENVVPAASVWGFLRSHNVPLQQALILGHDVTTVLAFEAATINLVNLRQFTPK